MWGATASTAHRNVYLLVRFAVIPMIREILNVPQVHNGSILLPVTEFFKVQVQVALTASLLL